MKVIDLPVGDVRPYENNPRRNDKAVKAVAESIKAFGFKVPIVVDKDHVIVTGHTRLKAAIKLGLERVPCIVAKDLTEQQVAAFRLADNKVSEQAEWDDAKLMTELQSLSFDFDMSSFGFDGAFDGFTMDKGDGDAGQDGFDMDSGDADDEAPDWGEKTQELVSNVLNLGFGHYEPAPGSKYDTPEIFAETVMPDVERWIPFDYAMIEPEPENKGIHFFRDDYKFERVWNQPQRYLEILSRFRVLLAPDFSPYGDMPIVMQAWNHYRKHWCARFWQENGLTVIPTIRSSTDPRSFEFFLEGEPTGGIVAFSSMWATLVMDDLKKEFDAMVTGLQPVKILVYGKTYDFMDAYGVPLERIPDFSETRKENRLKREAEGVNDA